MPTYEYACTACDEQIEVVQRFSDPPLTDCPACSGRLRKVFSPVGVVFKGSGFYKTDSRKSGRSSSSSSPSSSPSSSADSTPAPTPSKPESSPAASPDKSSGAPAA